MLLVIKIVIVVIIAQIHGEFIQQLRPYTPPIAPYPLLCKPEQVFPQTPPIPQEPVPSPLHQSIHHTPAPHESVQLLPNLPPPANDKNELLPKSLASNSSTEGLRFLMPFMDIEIELERRAYVMQESTSEDIFILHGNELFQLFLSRHEKRLSLMCYLEGRVKISDPQAAELLYWKGHVILVLAMEEHLEIYEIRRDLLQSRAENLKDPSRLHEVAPVFRTVQSLTLRGNLKKIYLFAPNEKDLMIMAVANFTKLYGKIGTFIRRKDRFEAMEEITVPALNVINMIGFKSKQLIIGKFIKNKNKTTLTIYEIDPQTLHLRNKQSLNVDSSVVKSFSMRNKNLIIACSPKQVKCATYLQMANGSFVQFKERTSQELAFKYISANSKFILASRQNEVLVFTDHFLDCYGGFSPDLHEISQVIGHHNEFGENFVLVLHETAFRILIRTVEMEVNEKFRKSRQTRGEENPLLEQHKLILKSVVDRARSFLPPRKEDMNIFHRMADLLIPKSKRFEPKKPPSNNPFERFMEMFVPKKEEPEEIDIIDMFENIFSPQSREAKRSDNKMDFFAVMDDIVKTTAKESEYKDPFTYMFENVFGLIRPKRRSLESEEPLKLKSGNIQRIKIQNPVLKSPTEILDRVTELRNNFFGFSRGKRSNTSGDGGGRGGGGGPSNFTLEITSHLKVNKLKVKNLIYKKEVIKGISLNATSSNSTKLIVKRKVSTHRVNASEIQYPDRKRVVRQYVPDLYYDLLPSLPVKHLKVQTINGLAWTDFYESIFLRNRDSTITGRLVLQSQVDVDHLKTPLLNGIVVDKLFNLRIPQVVQSNLIFSRFFVHDLVAEKVNGLKFEDDIVFSGREAYVETPVTMHHLSISGDLIVADKKIERFSDDSEEMEYKQFYTNKVVINGTLVINNLKRDSANQTKIVIDSNAFDADEIRKQYLLKNEEQHFEFPVKFDNTKVIAPHLHTKYLNDHLTLDYMLTDKVNNSKPLLIVFMKAAVKGDIICRDYKSKLAEIQENIVRPGDVVKITGHKRFEAPVATDDLETSKLNHMDFNDLVLKTDLSGPLKFLDSKSFRQIMVRNPGYVEKGINAVYLNKLPLQDLLNHDYHMERLYLSHPLLVSNLVFHKINGIPFNDFFAKLDVRDNQLVLHKDLIVEGNVVLSESVQLETINDLKWDDYVENLARTNEQSVIEGDVHIHGDLVISEDLWAREINGYNLEDVFQNILSRSKPQLITGHYTFENFNATHIDVLSINGRQANDYIDLSHNLVEIAGDIIAPKIVVKGALRSLKRQFLNFDNLTKVKENLMLKQWRNIFVLKNASYSQEITEKSNIQEELLKYLYKNAVRSNGNQTISGSVTFIRPMIKNLFTRLQFPSDIDLEFIDSDAVLRNSSSMQIIKGTKNFLRPIYANNFEAKKGLRTGLINNIDIDRFNTSLYRLSSKMPVQGHFEFQLPLKVGHLSLKGLINGLNSSDVYEIKNNSMLPPIAIDKLYIAQDADIKTINNMNLQYLLENRVTLRGPALEIFGFINFENLVIERNALLQSINNIAIDNLVYRHSSTLQTFSGHKAVAGFVELAGPAHVVRLNGKDLIDLYRNTIFIDQDYDFDSLSTTKEATFESGLRIMDENLRQRTSTESEKLQHQDFQNLLQNVMQKVDFIAGNILYLDYDWKTQVFWERPQNVTIDSVALKEIARVSNCEKQFFKISSSIQNRALFLENITSSRLSFSYDNIAIKVENFCKLKYRKVKSKISITAPKLLRVFGLKRFVESIDVLSGDHLYDRYVVVHALDLPTLKRNEVRIFKINTHNNTISDWQGLTQNIGDKLKLFELSNTTKILLTNGLANNHAALTIYHFNNAMQKFQLQQIIDGDYDVIEMLQLHNNTYTQLIITCHQCEKIYIYELKNEQQPNYQIFQIISMKSKIDKLFMFKLRNDNYMFVITENESGSFYLYKYCYVRGWVNITYGNFPNLQLAVPLMEMWPMDARFKSSDNIDSIPLLLLCNIDNCHIVNAIIQI